MVEPIHKTHQYIVSDEHKIVFLNIKKVASSSITECMQSKLNANVEFLWCKKYQDYFSFAFVRDPLDRLLSCYNNKIKAPNIKSSQTNIGIIFDKYIVNKLFYKSMSFKKFLRAISSLDPSEYDPHCLPQYIWVCDNNKNIVVDFIGKFESLKSDFDYVLVKNNLPILTLPHLNKTSFKEEVYDEETIELAKQVYGVQEDMEIFNYSFLKNILTDLNTKC